jgi:hypothetical protein
MLRVDSPRFMGEEAEGENDEQEKFQLKFRAISFVTFEDRKYDFSDNEKG